MCFGVKMICGSTRGRGEGLATGERLKVAEVVLQRNRLESRFNVMHCALAVTREIQCDLMFNNGVSARPPRRAAILLRLQIL